MVPNTKIKLRVAVFIASHIRYPRQMDLLRKAMGSLFRQTQTPHIHISMSFGEGHCLQDYPLLPMLICANSDRFSCTVQPKKMYQMQHIQYLMETYGDNYDMLMFLDDDDTYSEIRVESFTYAMKGNPLILSHPELACVRENTDNHGNKAHCPEYWAYAVTPQLLRTFFKEVLERKLLIYVWHTMGDMVFRYYLRFNRLLSISGFDTSKLSKPSMYIYNADNPHGVCNSGFGRCDGSKNTFYRRLFSNAVVFSGSSWSDKDDKFHGATLFEKLMSKCKGKPSPQELICIHDSVRQTQKLLDFYNDII